MQERRFRQVDVFGAEPYRGNPLAVVLDAAGLSEQEMRRFAQWTNLSETTFLCSPRDLEADYGVRIFTPGGELPFAGHPTLGSCHAWLEAGGRAKSEQVVVQECPQGLVRIRRLGEQLAFAAPPLVRSPPEPARLAELLAALGLSPHRLRGAQLLDNGPRWLGLLVDSVETVLELSPDHAALKRLGQKIGVAAVYGARTDEPRPDLEVRAFAAPIGVEEDPVTGSLNASLAQWLIEEGVLPDRYVAAQGARLGRAGRVSVERDAKGQVWVAGRAVTGVSGTVLL